VRVPKGILHKLQFFVELLYGGVCGAVPNTPLVGIGVILNQINFKIIIKTSAMKIKLI